MSALRDSFAKNIKVEGGEKRKIMYTYAQHKSPLSLLSIQFLFLLTLSIGKKRKKRKNFAKELGGMNE